MPISPALQRDPRSIVTPDAFEVAPALLGLPLASPGRRLAALLVDLAVIGLITLTTQSFGVVLGLVIAALFIREGFKRTPVRGSAFGRAMRLSVGCLGAWIGIITLVVWLSVSGRIGGGRQDAPAAPGGSPSEVTLSGVAGLMALAGGVGEARRLEEAPDAGEALVAATDLARRALGAGMTGEQVRDVLGELVPEDAPWAAEAPALVEQALAAALEAAPAGPEGPAAPPGDSAAADSAAAPADSLAGPWSDPAVADTLRELQARVGALSEAVEAGRRDLEDARDELRREREGGGFLSTVRGFLDELGFGFGWASLYLTVMLSWWKGQTIGKRALKIRVVRLDGEAITWWTAFERAGGYAAGLATGLLGFAQVYWDSNRQAIHDRIVGTVVVMDGAERVVDWEKAL